MTSIEELLRSRAVSVHDHAPVLLSLSKPGDKRLLRSLIRAHKVQEVVDDYDEGLRELYAINNPTIAYAPDFEERFIAHRTALVRRVPLARQGKWVYYPWLSVLVHVLDEADFQKVRTARNRNLIPEPEQKRFYDAVVGIGGMSVGNSVATTIVLQGGARRLRIADFDRLALTNTNRVRAGVQNLGIPKVVITARQIYEINPYAKVEIVEEGLTPKNVKRFFAGPPRLDVIIDEMDNLAVKVLLREEARRLRVPLVTAADNGDNAVVETERYDLNPNTPFFHGKMGPVTYKSLQGLGKFEIGRLITKWVGAETVTNRMKQSLLEMGKTIVSWPQLGGAALLNGAVVAYCVRRIVNGQPLERNRVLLSFDEKFVPGYGSPAARKARRRSAEAFKKIFNL